MLTDTHAHLDALDDDTAFDHYMERAREAGVTRILSMGGTDEGNSFGFRQAMANPAHIRCAIGYDRVMAPRDYDTSTLHDMAASEHCVAIGETGLDYHYEAELAAEQKVLFGEMLELASSLEKPVVVHSREADDDTFRMLSEYASTCAGRAPGVLHCFTGSPAFAERLLEIGMYISFSGILTFRNAESLRETARVIPEDRLLIETDSPYLAPIPMRGKANEPAFVRHVADCLATLRDWSSDECAAITTANASRLFNWD